MQRIYVIFFLMISLSFSFTFADDCPHRGDLESPYCDTNYNLVADTPTDPTKWVNPSTLIIAISPLEETGTYANEFRDLYQYLESCLHRKIINYPLQSNEAEIEAMRRGHLHISGFAAGTTIPAVNRAGAIPFAGRGNAQGLVGTKMITIVRADSPYYKLEDLKGKRIAHVSQDSNSGYISALTIFPEEGLIPQKNYQTIFTGKHDRSIIGVQSGDYDAATVALEVLERMSKRGLITRHKFRIIYESETQPSSSFSYAYNLAPELQAEIKECFYNYRFSDVMRRSFYKSDRFLPLNFKDHWRPVRENFKMHQEFYHY